MKYITQPNQSVYNLSIQNYGSIEGVFQLIRENNLDFGVLEAGKVIEVKQERSKRNLKQEAISKNWEKKRITVANLVAVEPIVTGEGSLQLQTGNYLRLTTNGKMSIYGN